MGLNNFPRSQAREAVLACLPRKLQPVPVSQTRLPLVCCSNVCNDAATIHFSAASARHLVMLVISESKMPPDFRLLPEPEGNAASCLLAGFSPRPVPTGTQQNGFVI